MTETADADRAYDETRAFLDSMTPQEMRGALMFLAGYSPDGFTMALESARREREFQPPPSSGGEDA